MRRSFALLLSLSAACALTVCLSACGSTAVRTVTVGSAMNGKVVFLSSGDRLLVTLDANPSTAFSWNLRSANRAILEPVGDEYETSSPPPKGFVGAGVRQKLTFAARSQGKTTLELVYKRPFSGPIDSYRLRVVVE
jgi:predicted secreted protein